LLLATLSQVGKAEPVYTVSGSELSRLLQISAKLERLNNQLQDELKTSKENLTRLGSELESCKAELTELQNRLSQSKTELTQLKNSLTTAENLLRKAETSFEKYKSEVEARIKRLTIQRNIFAVVGLIAAFF
jgi:chromosome segregation ATPase